MINLPEWIHTVTLLYKLLTRLFTVQCKLYIKLGIKQCFATYFYLIYSNSVIFVFFETFWWSFCINSFTLNIDLIFTALRSSESFKIMKIVVFFLFHENCFIVKMVAILGFDSHLSALNRIIRMECCHISVECYLYHSK